MDWNISYNEKYRTLFVTTYGTMERQEIEALVVASIHVLEKRDCNRVLFDSRAITSQGKIGTLDIYSIPTFFEILNIPRHFRLATVVPQEYKRDFVFFETVCQNRGYQVFVFYEIESALQWLKQ